MVICHELAIGLCSAAATPFDSWTIPQEPKSVVGLGARRIGPSTVYPSGAGNERLEWYVVPLRLGDLLGVPVGFGLERCPGGGDVPRVNIGASNLDNAIGESNLDNAKRGRPVPARLVAGDPERGGRRL
jgi:hypothetical protein